MKKIIIPAILAATILVAGMFAFMPVEKASTVHTTLQQTIGTLQVVACTKSMTGGGAASTCTFSTTGNAMVIHQITVSAAAFAGLTGGGVTTVTTIDGVATPTITLNTATTTATTGASSSSASGAALPSQGVDGTLVTTTSAIVGGTATGNVVVTLVAVSTGTISAA